jgi:hypothetical protein
MRGIFLILVIWFFLTLFAFGMDICLDNQCHYVKIGVHK